MNEINDRRQHARSNNLAFAPRVGIRCSELSLKAMELRDVSMGGARLQFTDPRVWFSLLYRKFKGLKTVMPADLVIDGQIVASIKIRVKRFSATAMGVEFMFSTRYFQELLHQTFFAELRAAAMKLEAPAEGNMRFYNDDMEYLEFSIEQGKIKSIEAGLRSRAAVRSGATVFFKFGIEGANSNVTPLTARELKRILRNLPYLTSEFATTAVELLESNLSARAEKQKQLKAV